MEKIGNEFGKGNARVGPYLVGETIGSGSIGKVKLAQHAISKEYAAVKYVRKDALEADSSLKRKVFREIALMKLMDHPHILRLYDVYENQTHLMLVLEYAEQGELFDYISENGYLEEDEALKFFQQIMDSVRYCQKRLISHRDLKPENILLDRNRNVKLADFGMGVLNFPGILLNSPCGSPHYAAPEIVGGTGYNGLVSDIWSCGVILYVLVSGGLPFDDDNLQVLFRKVGSGEFEIPEELSENVQDLIRRMLVVDVDRRYTIDQVWKHPWMKQSSYVMAPDDYCEDYTKPVRDPVSSIVDHLVELGWGEDIDIRAALASEEDHVVRQSYYQLVRHSMFKRAKRAGLTNEQLHGALQSFKVIAGTCTPVCTPKKTDNLEPLRSKEPANVGSDISSDMEQLSTRG
mmetsp:Transcript_10829/g.19590  ORF Transcript_10829/g.19590 Transcript_10829/m.19590 type:complete len:404 (-) Transcript_10829:1049-2260(-)|eukprot:CAMPEP_0182446698 /NCGR_PEP_ID=MMETSP1172-20130603/4654_1 /TAXON_ID=708627 /ORGANISM="Timspurckia oligopyrenoides, Strain CCMP3278" /LENGTH=403 /DNA_ID=CAMNT_0024642687 /DNA_START=265 /DNA_END=1476 /DNA_ORIENTATION=+